MTSSSTVQNIDVCLSARPAPLTPVIESTITPVGSIDTGLDQRRQRQRRRRDVAAGRGDQRRLLQVLAVQLGQPEHGRGQQLGLVVGEAVPRRVQRRVLQPVRRREVDEAADLAVQLRRQRHRRLVRQAEEDDVEPLGHRRVELVEHEVGVARREARVQGAGQRAGLAVAGGVDDLEVRMLGAQPEQLCAGVARRTDDANSLHSV